ncbi:hypothetical protein, partial [Parabacteroides goldsteinii]|uniref:hypothetical protein n=1 Tax=Parabacteroides goldsteinii TaxID=328812 RepID=UPI0025AE1B2F
EQYSVVILWAVKTALHHLHLFLMSILLLIIYPFISPNLFHRVPPRTMTYQCVHDLSDLKSESNKRATNAVQK